jgi:hypothetical protein
LFVQGEGEFVVDVVTGEAYASQSGTARLAEVDEATIRRFVSSADLQLKRATIPTAKGLRSSALLNEEQIMEVLEKYNPHKLALAAKAGMRMFLYKLAGYEVKVGTTDNSST